MNQDLLDYVDADLTFIPNNIHGPKSRGVMAKNSPSRGESGLNNSQNNVASAEVSPLGASTMVSKTNSPKRPTESIDATPKRGGSQGNNGARKHPSRRK